MHPLYLLPPWQVPLYFASLVVLLAISLKLWRRLEMPALLPVGLAIAAVGCLPHLAIHLLGIERVWQAIGSYFEPKPPDVFMFNDVEVTQSFFALLAAFRGLIAIGLLLASLAVLLHSRRLAMAARAGLAHGPMPPGS